MTKTTAQRGMRCGTRSSLRLVLAALPALVVALGLVAVAPGASAANGNDAATGSYGYVWTDIPLAWNEIRASATSTWTLHDTTAGLAFAAGFSFKSYGSSYTSGMVSDNGWIIMGSDAGAAAPGYTPVPLPNGGMPNRMIAPFWVDMEQDCVPTANSPPAGTSGRILGKTEAANLPYRDRVLVTEWDGISLYGNNGECGAFNIFEVNLYEGTDVIEYHYRQTHTYSPQGVISFCQDASVGIDNDDGSKGLNLGYRTGCVGDYNLANQAKRMFKNDPNGADVTLTVAPSVGTTFQVSATDDPVKYTLVSSPAGASGTLSTNFPTAGQTYYKAAPSMTFTPAADFCGTDTLKFQADDLVDAVTTYTITFSNTCSANQAPSAVCTITTTGPYVTGQFIAFSSAGSSDPNAGDTLSYAWTFPSGIPPTSTLASPTPKWLAPNTYPVSLTVTDQVGAASTPASCPITVVDGTGPPPPPPSDCSVADFIFSTGTLEHGQAVSFTDRSVAAVDATITDWAWSFGDGHSSSGPSAHHAFAAPGDYVVRLVIADSEGCTSYAEATLRIVAPSSAAPEDPDTGAGYAPPTVEAGSDATVKEGDKVTLSATGSAVGGRGLAWAWRQVGGPVVTLRDAETDRPTFDAPFLADIERPVTLTFEVRVMDGSAESAPDTVKVVVQPRNHRPLARAGEDIHVRPGQPFTLDSQGSSDPDGPLVSFAWSLAPAAGGPMAGPDAMPGLPSSAARVTLVAPETVDAFSFDIVLTVDDGTATAADTVRVWVEPGRAAAAAFEATPQRDGSVVFHALIVADEYEWVFGDGVEAKTTEPTVVHQYAKAGRYDVQLRVAGAAEPAQQSVLTMDPADESVPQGAAGEGSTPTWVWGALVAVGMAALVGGLLLWSLRQRAHK